MLNLEFSAGNLDTLIPFTVVPYFNNCFHEANPPNFNKTLDIQHDYENWNRPAVMRTIE